LQNKGSFTDQREHITILDKRRYLTRMKFEEHCEPKGKIIERICPSLEECLLTHDQSNKFKKPLKRNIIFIHSFS